MKKILVTLVGGNFLAQLINALFIPLSTRLYTPEDFKSLSVFVSILMIISTVGGLRFDAAILKAEDTEDIHKLLTLAVTSAVFIGSIVFIILIVTHMMGIYEVEYYFWLLPFLIVGIVVYSSFSKISNIREEYSRLSKSRVSQAVIGNSTLSLWGWFIGSSFGLFLGYSLMYCAGVLILYVKIRFYSLSTLKNTWSEYIDYPKYSVTETLADVAGYQLPITLIGIYVQSNLAGYLFIAIKIMNLPITILARALSSFYVVKIRDLKTGLNLDKSILICFFLGLVSLVFCSVFFRVFSDDLLGKDWEDFGNILFLIIPWFLFQFLTIIFNPVFYIFSKERFISRFQTTANIIRILAFVTALYLDKKNIVVYLSVINSFFYIAWLFSIRHVFRSAKRPGCNL
ncbi:lipopolysaccharide biosynthesis protein [Psychrobacter immobilis]|uniref:lipopolysaccharide biosynthesis protein n=1 Tax=Psychrobacter immobilis TaxID=498 RepID=UPI003FCF56FB